MNQFKHTLNYNSYTFLFDNCFKPIMSFFCFNMPVFITEQQQSAGFLSHACKQTLQCYLDRIGSPSFKEENIEAAVETE